MFDSECCIGGESMAAPCLKLFFDQHPAWGWAGQKKSFSKSLVWPDQDSN